MNWYMLIPVIVGIICAIFGYLIGRLNKDEQPTTTTNDTDSYLLKIKNLESDLEDCRKSKQVSKAPNEVLIPFDAIAAKTAFGKAIKTDDLTVIEGIGPKISELFKNNGITTWKALSESSQSACQAILDKGGERFKLHKPTTWPTQAKLAYEGKWEELKTWQDELDGGR